MLKLMLPLALVAVVIFAILALHQNNTQSVKPINPITQTSDQTISQADQSVNSALDQMDQDLKTIDQTNSSADDTNNL